MRILKHPVIVFHVLALLLLVDSCNEPAVDPCYKTKWPQAREFEIKLAVHALPSDAPFPGSDVGSQYPAEFEKMVVSGTIEKIECNDLTTGPVELGNSYLNSGVDLPAPIDVAEAYWIGHVVYVYEFGNDKDHIHINLAVTITMKDRQAYMCNVSQEIFYQQIIQVPGETYYSILLDIYSDNWVKV